MLGDSATRRALRRARPATDAPPARSKLDSAARPRVGSNASRSTTRRRPAQQSRRLTRNSTQVHRSRRLTGRSTPPVTMPRLGPALLLFAARAITTATASLAVPLCPGQCTCIGDDCGYASTGETVEFVEPTTPTGARNPNVVPCRDDRRRVGRRAPTPLRQTHPGWQFRPAYI